MGNCRTTNTHFNKNTKPNQALFVTEANTHVVVLAVLVHTATLVQAHALAVAEHEARVTQAALHAGGGRQVAEDGEEVGAGGGARRGAV